MPSATFTVSSGSERLVEVYPEQERALSGVGASVHSPETSGSQSLSSDSWSDLEGPYEDEGIEPFDAAPRSRAPSRRPPTTEAQPAPSRRNSSRRVAVEREEAPRRRSPQRHHSSRHRREESRRTPSDESASVASYDDYPYGHHGGAPMPPPRAYPQTGGYRHPAQSHGGYPPGMTSAAPYPDPYGQALVHMSHDPFAYQQPNPFAGHSQASNPFSPMSSGGGTSYFGMDPHAPLPPAAHAPRPQGPPRPHSMYGSELMSHYSHPGMPYPGYVMPPGYPPAMPWPYPPPPVASSPAPKEEKKDTSELDSLKALIQKHEEARLAAEEERITKERTAAAAAAQKAAEEEAEKRKKEEVAAASKSAKEKAEETAAGAAKKAKEEAETKLAEAKKAHADAEKKAKDLEEEAKKNKPTPDMLKAPIRFKDAVGRKFSFPFHLCKSWKGMEGLIRQAFLHVDTIGEHVHQGHYDLMGPDGEIILPQVWEVTIQPDWEVKMELWPIPEDKHDDRFLGDLGDPFAGLGLGPLSRRGSKRKKEKGKDGKKKKTSDPMLDLLGMPSVGPMAPPPPPTGMGVLPDPFGLGMFPPGISPVEDRRRPKARSKSTKDLPPLTRWMIGGGSAPARKK